MLWSFAMHKSTVNWSINLGYFLDGNVWSESQNKKLDIDTSIFVFMVDSERFHSDIICEWVLGQSKSYLHTHSSLAFKP